MEHMFVCFSKIEWHDGTDYVNDQLFIIPFSAVNRKNFTKLYFEKQHLFEAL